MTQLLKNFIRGAGSVMSVYPVRSADPHRFSKKIRYRARRSFLVDHRKLTSDFRRAIRVVVIDGKR